MNSLEWLFEHDISEPCFVIDEARLLHNLSILNKIQINTNAKILLALKAYSAWNTFHLLSRSYEGCLYGICASSIDEARLGKEKFGGEIHAFAAAWSGEEFIELFNLARSASITVSFNSLNQWLKCRKLYEDYKKRHPDIIPIQFGLRINPEHSEGGPHIYNPCAPGSRLGIRLLDLQKASKEDLIGITGLHFHTLCEQNSDALARTLKIFAKKFAPWFKNMKWLNFGGGHHITRADYNLELLENLLKKWGKNFQIYLEPGEAVALNAGWLVAKVLDIINADLPIAILNVSAACHMPDVLEMPYKPPLYYLNNDNKVLKADQEQTGYRYRIAGKSCLAGDVIGEYIFNQPINTGDKLIFGDMAIYSMVKTNTFNGLRLPAIGLLTSGCKEPRELIILRKFDYNDFLTRLGG